MSTRETILTNLATQLATITTAGGFNSDVNSVYRDEVPSTDSQTEGVDINLSDSGNDTVAQYCASNLIRSSMIIQIEAYVRGLLGTAMSDEIENIITDIRTLIHAPVSLGSSVCFSELIGIPEVYIDEDNASVLFDLRIDYAYDSTSP